MRSAASSRNGQGRLRRRRAPAEPDLRRAEARTPAEAAPERAETEESLEREPVEGRSGDLDLRSFVVLGEGLAAGFGDFSLAEEYQRESFPAQLARQMGACLSQPCIESPGLGDAPGLPSRSL